MPSNVIYFLRHAETIVDEQRKASDWIITEEGKLHAEKLANKVFRQKFDYIYSSSERKAIQTAEPFAIKNNLEIIQCFEFRELNRDKGGFLSLEKYLENVELMFKNRERIYDNWETGNSALQRFFKKYQEIDNQHENKKILIVSHGLILNLFFAYILDEFDEILNRWKATSFCDYGIIDKGTILKDITSLQ